MGASKQLRCLACNQTFELEPLFNGCPRCRGTLEVEYDYAVLARDFPQPPDRGLGIWRYAALLPVEAKFQPDERSARPGCGEGARGKPGGSPLRAPRQA